MLSLPSVRGRPSGSRHRSRGFPQDRSVLAIDGEHLQVASDGVVQRIAFAEVAGIFANEDGRRRVVDHAGWGITVEPTLWRNGTRAVELLDSRVPPELRMHFLGATTTPSPDHRQSRFDGSRGFVRRKS